MRNWSWHVFLMELRTLIAYRSDFWVNFIGQTFFSILIAYFLWKSIFTSNQVEVMQGFTIQGMVFYYLMAPLIFRIQQGKGIGFISREIYDGNLNKYLLYPINVFRYKIMVYLAHSSFFLVQLFIILFLYQSFFYNTHIYQFSFVNILYFISIVLMACLTFFYLFSSVEFMAFWHDNIWSLGVILRFFTSFLGGALIPLKFFPEWAQTLVSFTPFPYLIDFPMQALLGNLSFYDFIQKIGITLLWLLAFRFLAIFVWNRGKFVYTGVGI